LPRYSSRGGGRELSSSPPTIRRSSRGLGNTERLGGKIGSIDLIAEAAKCKASPVVKKSPILTDDYNPANLLLMQKK
jgi:hypothetical protein